MAQKFQFDLVSPERRLASVAVEAVQIPGADGDLMAMADHAPLITTLRPGILRVQGGDAASDTACFVTGGFADVSGPAVTVLAEQALPVGEVTTDVIDGWIAEARDAHDKARAVDAANPAVDVAAKRVADLEAAKAQLAG